MIHHVASLPSLESQAPVRPYPIPQYSIALWTLGQNGFLLKSPEGTLVAVDPYLSNSCVTLNTVYGLDFSSILNSLKAQCITAKYTRMAYYEHYLYAL